MRFLMRSTDLLPRVGIVGALPNDGMVNDPPILCETTFPVSPVQIRDIFAFGTGSGVRFFFGKIFPVADECR